MMLIRQFSCYKASRFFVRLYFCFKKPLKTQFPVISSSILLKYPILAHAICNAGFLTSE
jgi:hypothetical protein